MAILKIRSCDDRYVIYDYLFDKFVFSVTTLLPGMSTKGHSHGHEELYIIKSGEGLIGLDDVNTRLQEGDMIVIPGNTHHIIKNMSDIKPFTFFCVFESNRRLIEKQCIKN